MIIIFATGNAGKMREIRDILADTDAKVYSLKELGIVSETEETGETFAENAYIKVKEIYDILGAAAGGDDCRKGNGLLRDIVRTSWPGDVVIMADDSGLSVDCLGGFPGVHSARFMGHDTSYDIKNAALTDKLKGVPDEKRGAAFVCHICALRGDGTRYDAEDEMRGRIAYEARGLEGFGYDPIFWLPKYGCTSAEITEEEKNAISHRGKALRSIRAVLAKEGLIRPV